MILKPRLANSIAMILGGCFVSWIGILSCIGIGGRIAVSDSFGFIPGIFWLLGILCICSGSLALVKRNKMAIVINDSGIDLPPPNIYQKDSQRSFIEWKDIETISKHESIKGRLIEITTKTGDIMLVQARHYCELDKFIEICKNHGVVTKPNTRGQISN